VCDYRKLEKENSLASRQNDKLEPEHAQLESSSVGSQYTDNLVPPATDRICNNNSLIPTSDTIIGTSYCLFVFRMLKLTVSFMIARLTSEVELL